MKAKELANAKFNGQELDMEEFDDILKASDDFDDLESNMTWDFEDIQKGFQNQLEVVENLDGTIEQYITEEQEFKEKVVKEIGIKKGIQRAMISSKERQSKDGNSSADSDYDIKRNKSNDLIDRKKRSKLDYDKPYGENSGSRFSNSDSRGNLHD